MSQTSQSKAVEAGKEARGDQNVQGLVQGVLYTGTVTQSSLSKRLLQVKVDNSNDPLTSCQWAGSIFSGILGIKSRYIPPKGTRVTLARINGTNYILGTIPSDSPDMHSGKSLSKTGVSVRRQDYDAFEDADDSFSVTGKGKTMPNDMTEGDFEIAHDMGAAISILGSIAMLSSGDRAKVEACCLNDMVRIISENYKHFSSFGEMEIFNDGRLNVMFNGTSYEHEAWGVDNKDSQKLPSDENGVDFNNLDDTLETGRWRFSQYIGWLGDFLHEIITDPIPVIGDYATMSSTALRSGRGRFHIATDGTILQQSVAEIVLEKKVRIPVPVALKRWEDPIVKKRDFEALNNKYLELWKDFKDPTKIHEAAYQLREYSRWLSDFHGYARFLQMEDKGAWYVPSENETPDPDMNCHEKDREAAGSNKDIDYIATYSTIRIMRDGSHVHQDSYGNSYLTGPNGIEFSTPKHLKIYTGGDFIVNAGQNIRLKARRSIDIVAVAGGLKLKARAFMHALCEWGTIWLKSDADEENVESAADPANDPAPEVKEASIILQTSKGKMLFKGDKDVTVSAEGDNANVTMQSKMGYVRSQAGFNGVTVSSEDGVQVKSSKFSVKAPRVTFSGSVFSIGKGFKVTGGSVSAQSVNASFIQSTGISTNNGKDGIGDNVDTYDGPEQGDITDTEEITDLEVTDTEIDLSWDFLDKDEYIWDGHKQYEPVAMQFVRNDEPLPDGTNPSANYDSWSYSSDALKPAPKTGSNAPWPGKGGDKYVVYSGGESLYTPSSVRPKDLKTKATGFNLSTFVHRFLKKP